MVAVLCRIISLLLLEVNGVISMESILSFVDLNLVFAVLTETSWTTIIALVTGLVYYQTQAQSNNSQNKKSHLSRDVTFIY